MTRGTASPITLLPFFAIFILQIRFISEGHVSINLGKNVKRKLTFLPTKTFLFSRKKYLAGRLTPHLPLLYSLCIEKQEIENYMWPQAT